MIATSRVMIGVGLIALTLGPASPDVLAQVVPSDPNVCFCLQHKSTAQLVRGCKGSKAPTDFYATARCTDPETAETFRTLVTDAWKPLAEGAPGCEPCRSPQRDTRDVPRGDDPPPSPSAPP